MKIIDTFNRNDDETTVTVELSTAGPPAQVAVSTFNSATGDRVGPLLLSPDEARRLGEALLAAQCRVGTIVAGRHLVNSDVAHTKIRRPGGEMQIRGPQRCTKNGGLGIKVEGGSVRCIPRL